MRIEDYVQQVTTADGRIVDATDPSKKDIIFTIETTVAEDTAAPRSVRRKSVRAVR